MSGETDLATMLGMLDVEPRDGTWTLLTRRMPEHVAREQGESPRFVAAWLTLRVHSALDAVGLTAAVSRALADAGIACNVLAGFHHDHLLVPAARRADAIAALHALRGN